MGKECRFDHDLQPAFWFAYAPAQRSFTGSVATPEHKNGSLIGAMGEAFRNGEKPKQLADKVVTWWGNVVCPITETIATDVIGEKEPRGLVLQITRAAGRRHIQATILERCPTIDLPEPFDVKTILLRMWNLRGLKGGA